MLFSVAIATFSISLWPAFMALRRKNIQVLRIDRQDDRTSGYAAITAMRKCSGATALGDLRVYADKSATVVRCTRDLHISAGSFIDVASARYIFLESDVTVFEVASASKSLWVQPYCQFRWLDAPLVMLPTGAQTGFSRPLHLMRRRLRPTFRQQSGLPNSHESRAAGNRGLTL